MPGLCPAVALGGGGGVEGRMGGGPWRRRRRPPPESPRVRNRFIERLDWIVDQPRGFLPNLMVKSESEDCVWGYF
jgi:hypothetical protein